MGIPTIKFHRIEKREAAEILRQNYDIAMTVGIVIPDKTKTWLEKFGVFKLESSSSLYHCFNCRTGDLTEEENESILIIAKKELTQNKMGKGDEQQYFFVCDDCKQRMHKAHTT